MELKAQSLFPTHPWSTGIQFFLVGELMGRFVLALSFPGQSVFASPHFGGIGRLVKESNTIHRNQV